MRKPIVGLSGEKASDSELLQEAMLKKLRRLLRVVHEMNRDRSGPLAEASLRIYAWKVEISVRDLVTLMEKWRSGLKPQDTR